MAKTYRGRRQYENNLWIARKRAGFPQKRVAALLGAKSLSVISEYESGRKLPSLQAALKLELIYGTPLSELFPDLFAELKSEIASVDPSRSSLANPICHMQPVGRWSPLLPELATSAMQSLENQT